MQNSHYPHQNNLLFGAIDPKMDNILQEARKLLFDFPEISNRITADLNTHALEQKKKRLADDQWRHEHAVPLLSGFTEEELNTGNPAPEPELKQGRPRMSADVVYIFMVLRGAYGGIDDQAVWSRFIDSNTLRFHLTEMQVRNFPKQSTIRDNVNVLSNATREFIFHCQLSQVLNLKLDDFSKLYIDSTHVHANSAWPTDSGLILKFVERAYLLGRKLREYGLPNFRIFSCKRWLKELRSLDFLINCTKGKRGDEGKKKRVKLYKTFLDVASKLENRLTVEYEHLQDQVIAVDLLPSEQAQLSFHWNLIFESLCAVPILNDVAYRRVILGEDVKRQGFEQIFSVSDRSAAFIKKGGRETVFGYRPQLGRSANGFITSLIVPEGNAADSTMLVSAVQNHIDRTAVTPAAVSTDDGYASKLGHDNVLDLGVEALSISGSKGKKLTDEEDWDSEYYQELRRYRSAAESLMYVVKFNFRFDRFSRRGIQAVRAEALEKAIAHNFWRIAHEKEKQNNLAIPTAA